MLKNKKRVKNVTMTISEEDVEKELELHDQLDLVLVLAIGPSPAPHLVVQKRAILLSKLLGVDSEAEPYHYGLYSETITEKLQSAKNATLFRKRDGKYELTPMGMRAYEILKRLVVKKGEDILHFIEILHRISDDELLALTYHLFPESFEESKIKEKVRAMIEQFKGKGIIKARREGEKIVLEADA
jgi:DNA-binding transcriptional ArsR family regulator